MPRGRPKGSKNKRKGESSSEFTKPNDVNETEEYQFVGDFVPISNWNANRKKFMARVYGSLSPNFFKVIDYDGKMIYQGDLKTETKYGKTYRVTPDGRKFDMSGWEIESQDNIK